MATIECQSQKEYVAKLEELRSAGTEIQRVYLHWYEGAGTRQERIQSGPAVKAMCDKLPVNVQMKVALALQSSGLFPPEIERLAQEYRACQTRDYEVTGGYSEVRGEWKNAFIVIEHD